MSNFKAKILWCAASLILTLGLLTACGPKDDIVGRWTDPNCNTSGFGANLCQVEFFKDGTLSAGGLTLPYIWVDDHRMKMTVGGISVVYDVILNGDSLTLDPEGSGQKAEQLQRVK